MNFWIITGVMTVMALVIVLLPLLRAHRASSDRRAENLTIYRRRLHELEREVAEGLLPAEELDATRAEIEKRLLEDLEGDTNGTPVADTRTGGGAVRGPIRRPAFWLILVALPIGAIGLYTLLGVNPETLERMGAAGETEKAVADMPELVAGLAQRLRENPGNGEGWALLGRSYMFLEQPARAAEAFARAYALLGDDPDLLIDYANALSLSAGGNLRGRAGDLVQKALAGAPDNPRVLWLAGLAAAQRGEAAEAKAHWQNLLQQLDPQSEDAAVVRQRLAALDGGAAAAQTAAATSEQGGGASKPTAPGVVVTVSLAPDIASRVAPSDPVFVFARAADGPPMPLAAVRRRVADLPFTVRLDDGDAMMPGRSLSDADRIVVGARISRSGDPIPRSGDMEGVSEALRPTETGEVRVVIDSILP